MNLRSVVITGVLALSVPVLAACGGLVEPTASPPPPAAVEGEQAGAAATEAAGVETPNRLVSAGRPGSPTAWTTV